MSVVEISPDLLKAKYILISWSDGLHATPIKDDAELEVMFNDNSMDDGDVLITVAQASEISVRHYQKASFVTEPTKTLLDEPFDLKAEERARKALDLIKNNPDAFNCCVESHQEHP